MLILEGPEFAWIRQNSNDYWQPELCTQQANERDVFSAPQRRVMNLTNKSRQIKSFKRYCLGIKLLN